MSADAIIEENENEEIDLIAKPEDFVACIICATKLSYDEKVINARFVNEAMSAGQDVTIFPICIRCNFENLNVSKQIERENQAGEDSKPIFCPAKKLYEENMHQNSEEFK